MKYGYILHTLFFALFTNFVLAQGTCPAPAPSQLNVVSSSHTEIELDWPSVSGSQAYMLRTIDATTGIAINLDTIVTEGYLQENLNPGQEYIFEVSSSYCVAGPFGDPIVLQSPTNIVVVDIIFQFECMDLTEEQTTEQIEAGESSSIPINPDGCYIVTFPNPNDDGETFSLLIGNSSSNSIFVGDFANNPDDFVLDGSGPLNGSVQHPRNRTDIELFSMQMIKTGRGTNVEIACEIDTEVTVVYCNECSWSDNGLQPGFGLESYTPSSNTVLTIYPNPANDLFTIEMTNEGATVEVFDMNGRQWFRQSLEGSSSLQIDASNWPSGTYIVRSKSNEQAPLLQHFLKQH